MEQLDGATIFWLIALGMVLGAIAKVAMGNKSMDLIPNLIAGVLGSVIVGGIGVVFQIPGSMVFGLLGGLSILFIANVFNVMPEMDEH